MPRGRPKLGKAKKSKNKQMKSILEKVKIRIANGVSNELPVKGEWSDDSSEDHDAINIRKNISNKTNKTKLKVPTHLIEEIKKEKIEVDKIIENVNYGSLECLVVNPGNLGSIHEGQETFKRLIDPIEVEEFFDTYWEKEPCFIRKGVQNIFKSLISCDAIDKMLRQHDVEFTKNIDITSYKEGVRQTLNPEGRALPPEVWNFYNDGCSIRLLNPQIFIQNIHRLNATLQEYFHCMVGTNIYLTPPNSQGFAPHYDDIEAFVLQVEGKKKWKLYAPRTPEEKLPRYSSGNLQPDEIGNPILEIVVEPGDVLYFPRGIIHQASTEPGYHSLHITLSMYQKQSYADLFECLLPIALSSAAQKNVKLRQGLPLNIWYHLGLVNSNSKTNERQAIIKRTKELFKELINDLPLDDAVDQIAKKYQYDAVPPILSENEKVRTTFGNQTSVNKNGKAVIGHRLDLNTQIRLIRANILRLVSEENSVRVYYYLDNSVEYHEYEVNFMEIDNDNVPALCQLIKSYPKYTKVANLAIEEPEDKIEIAQYLWDRGLLMIK